MSAGEIAELTGKTRQAVDKYAKKNNWPFEEDTGQARGGKLKKYLIAALPPEVQAASRLFHRTHGAGYDWLGAIGVVLKLPHNKSRWFCSEWCAYAIGCTNPHRYTPGELADTIKP